MFDFVRDNKRLFQFLLLLLIVPSFVLVGLGRDMVAGQSSVASVDGKAISSAELDAAVRQRADMVRQSNPRIDPKELDTPDFRRKVLASILAERTMLAGIEKFRLTPDDDRIARQFRENPMYQAVRNPDGTLNTEAVGMSSAAFLQRLRNEIAQQQFMEPGSVLSVTAKAPAKQVEEVVMQKREIQVQYFQVRDWQAKVQPTDEQLLAFFKSEGQKTRYIAAESVDVEMAVLDLAALQARVKIADEAVKAHYDANIRRYASAEERKASVIVIGFEASGGKDAAKKKADAALAAAKADPAKFADVARKFSTDELSAKVGGDLGFLPPQALDEKVDKVLFSLEKGAVSGVIETESDFQIIRAVEIRGGEKKPFESVRAEIAAELAAAEAKRKYPEAADEFSEQVFSQGSSFDVVRDKLGARVQTVTGVGRKQAPQELLRDPKIQAELFSTTNLTNKSNSKAVEVSPQVLVSIRVLKHSPEHRESFETVKEQVRTDFIQHEAKRQAGEAAAARVAALGKAPEDLAGLSPVLSVSYKDTQNVAREVLIKALTSPVAPLPQVHKVDMGADGFAVVRVSKIEKGEAADPAMSQQLLQQYQQAWAEAENRALLEAMKVRFKAKIKTH